MRTKLLLALLIPAALLASDIRPCGGGGGGSVTIAGTTGQITATGTACTAGNSGTCVLSLSSPAPYEPALGNPGVSGYVLSSTTLGVRSWVVQSGGGSGIVNAGTTGQVAAYTGAGTTVGGVGPGTATTVLHGNASGQPGYGAVVLTTDVSGVLPVANGGTGGAFYFPPSFVLCAGPCVAGTTASNWKWTARQAIALTGCLMDAVTYPTGSGSLTVDIYKNSITTNSVFSSTILTIAGGATAYNLQTGMSANATLAQGDWLWAKVTAVGGTVAGQYVNVECY